jgi:hypothetical protein
LQIDFLVEELHDIANFVDREVERFESGLVKPSRKRKINEFAQAKKASTNNIKASKCRVCELKITPAAKVVYCQGCKRKGHLKCVKVLRK